MSSAMAFAAVVRPCRLGSVECDDWNRTSRKFFKYVMVTRNGLLTLENMKMHFYWASSAERFENSELKRGCHKRS
ncbi:hypothetical protein COL8621_03718 [Actibacterium lipolyticum]|uniref:Uncharacterized protein n=1 Tax=Actibacterium lipolyticum TaxID=1524263 RepID=A0A238L854_9RHOB|nr:hypothetical protein COL8621_03718 [Actibacterium lipolyticum]